MSHGNRRKSIAGTFLAFVFIVWLLVPRGLSRR